MISDFRVALIQAVDWALGPGLSRPVELVVTPALPSSHSLCPTAFRHFLTVLAAIVYHPYQTTLKSRSILSPS